MHGKKNYSEKLFASFQLSQRVPEDNFYRLLNQELDLRFLYKETAQYNGAEGKDLALVKKPNLRKSITVFSNPITIKCISNYNLFMENEYLKIEAAL